MSAVRLKLCIACPGATIAAAAATAVAGRNVVSPVPVASPSSTNGHRQSLDYACLTLPLPWIHSVVDREVPADHVG